MILITWFIDVILHLDKHLVTIVQDYGTLTYLILFLIIFAETGLVITPFLPGDSLLFAVGALAATGALSIKLLLVLLVLAAILGNTVNYFIGKLVGTFIVRKRLVKKAYLERAHAFFEKYGGKTIIITRFVPILRTVAPFFVGLGAMTFIPFTIYNIVGGVAWVSLFLLGGYYFGNIPFIKEHFSIVIIAIIAVSLVPVVIEYFNSQKNKLA